MGKRLSTRTLLIAGVALAAGAAAVVTSRVPAADAAAALAPGAPMAAAQAASVAAVLASGAPVSGASPAALRVAMHYVPPPFVGGEKVRTPALPDIELADALGKALGGVKVEALALQAGAQAPSAVGAGSVAIPAGAEGSLPGGVIALLNLPENARAPSDGTVIVQTGYVSRPMAIMRTDTDITSWKQLAGRTVCVAEGGRYVGWLAKTYGAIEMVKRAPADSLLALRIGECDAAVHDEALLRALLKLPEWKKFSAALPPGPASNLVFAVPTDDRKTLDAARGVARDWRRQGHISRAMTARARDIAFEVYLDQEVPDCH